MKKKIYALTIVLLVAVLFAAPFFKMGSVASTEKYPQISDHFDGSRFFNPQTGQVSHQTQGQEPRRGVSRWFWRWLFKDSWPEVLRVKDVPNRPSPAASIPKGNLQVIPVGHATFLIQMDGVNILIDPIWSERCSPVSWAGPRRYQAPGIRFEDLPPIDVVLLSHNHYDHLDIPTLERLAGKGTTRAVVTLGNRCLVRDAGMVRVDELDWWQSVLLSEDVSVTVVPAQHFSSRTLWDRNETLWGGFVISGLSGNVFYSGDTGYGPHFREIARRFAPIKMAILPISPFRPSSFQDPKQIHFPGIHIGPAEAVQAHVDMRAKVSVAAHFRVFQLGFDGFNDAVNELALTLKKHHIDPGAFIAPVPGQRIVDPISPE